MCRPSFSVSYQLKKEKKKDKRGSARRVPRTVCGSVCLNVEKMAPLVNIFEISFPFGIEFDIVETIVERKLSLHVCGLAHCT